MPDEAELDLLIDQSQKLCQVYDDRRKDADASAAGLLTASVGLVTLTITGTAIASASTAGKFFAVLVTLAGAVSGILAITARSVAGLRPAPAIEPEGRHYVAAARPRGRVWNIVWGRTGEGARIEKAEREAPRAKTAEAANLKPINYLAQDVATLRSASLLSHESTAFRTAHAELDDLRAKARAEPRGKILVLATWRAREADLHYLARQKERMVAYSGIVLGVATVLAAITGIFVLWK